MINLFEEVSDVKIPNSIFLAQDVRIKLSIKKGNVSGDISNEGEFESHPPHQNTSKL
jgi:hypothetical protein